MQDKVEVLQQRLLDEASYHAFVDSAIEGFFRTTRDGRLSHRQSSARSHLWLRHAGAVAHRTDQYR
jgi:hypothetical protein